MQLMYNGIYVVEGGLHHAKRFVCVAKTNITCEVEEVMRQDKRIPTIVCDRPFSQYTF